MKSILLRLFFVSISGVSLFSGSPVHAERIWDDELNRYLTPQEMMQADVYLSQEEAAKLILEDSEKIRKVTITLSPQNVNDVQKRIGWEFPEREFECFIGETQGKTDGWALVRHCEDPRNQ